MPLTAPFAGAVDPICLTSLSGLGNCHDGTFWANWVVCLVRDGTGGGTDYPRWQVDVKAKSPGSSGASVRNALSNAGWNSLIAGQTRRQEKIALHHISARSSGLVLPVSAVGPQADVSHLCDQRHCWREEHLVVETHIMNMSRQRCGGVQLLVWDRKIVAEIIQCTHSGMSPMQNHNFTNVCRKVVIVELDDAAVLSLTNQLDLVCQRVLLSADRSSGPSRPSGRGPPG